MRIDDDAAFARLPEYFRQARHGQLAATDQIGQHLARPHRRQLIDIADDQQRCLIGQRLEHAGHKRHVDHGYLIQDKEIALEGKVGSSQETALLGIKFEQAMDGLGLEPGALG
jgi:hypothetical protein